MSQLLLLVEHIDKPSFSWLHRNLAIHRLFPGFLSVFDFRRNQSCTLFTQSKSFPVNLQCHALRRVRIVTYRQQSFPSLAIDSDLHLVVGSRDTRILFPEAYHFSMLYTEFIPNFPNGSRVTIHSFRKPRITHRHTILHAKPTVAASVQHISHQSKWYSRRLDQPIGRCHLVIKKALSKPHLIQIWEIFRVLICRPFRKSSIGM